LRTRSEGDGNEVASRLSFPELLTNPPTEGLKQLLQEPPVPVRNLIRAVLRWLHAGFNRPGLGQHLRYGDVKGRKGRRAQT
jgi:hypothetical protein